MTAPGTAPPTTPQDWSALARHLAAHGHDLADDPPPCQFTSGLANLNYLIMFDRRPAVLRRPPMGDIQPGAHDMGREARVLTAVAPVFDLAPKVLHLCADPSVLGAPFLIMEYRPGRGVRDRLPADLAADASASATLSRLLVETLAAIHALDPDAIGLGGLGRPDGFLARTAAGWVKRAEAAADGAPPRPLAAIAAWLGRRTPPDASRAVLLHNDFKLDNMLLALDAPARAVAVVDWDQATRGHPLFDLATLLSYWVEPDDPPAMRALGQMPTASPGFWRRAEVVTAYGRLTGVDVADWRFHRVLGMLKLAVIFQQLHARWRRGGTTDPRYAEFGPLADGLFDFTHEIAMGRAD